MAIAAVAYDDHVIVEERSSGLWIRLNRPDRRNALSSSVYAILIETLRGAAQRADVQYLVLSGVGDHFCSGGDLDGFAPILAASSIERADIASEHHERTAGALTRAIWDLPQPLVVAARGHAIGAGAQLVLAADMAIVSDTLRFSIPQVRLAHTADHGESWYLPRRVGMTQAARLLLTGEHISGARAVELGIACALFEDGKLDAGVEALALSLAAGSATAQRENKRLLRESWSNDVFVQSRLEREALARSVQTPDFSEAITAFSEKRPPVFAKTANSHNDQPSTPTL